MRTFYKIALVCLSAVFCLGVTFPSISLGESGSSPVRTPKKASDIYHERSMDLHDYELNWTAIPFVDAQLFLPDMRCDLSKKYFDLSQRDGFKVNPPVNNDDHYHFIDEGGDYGSKGVMPWPGILGHWQDWNSGVYLVIDRVKETDLDNKVYDYMVLRLYSMCTDELLAESSTLVQNSNLNQLLKLPTLSYGLRMSAGMLGLKVNKYSADPKTDEIEVELRYVDSFTKEPSRSLVRVFRFL